MKSTKQLDSAYNYTKIKNYKDKLTLDIYRRLTQLDLDKNNLYKQIYQQLTYC